MKHNTKRIVARILSAVLLLGAVLSAFPAEAKAADFGNCAVSVISSTAELSKISAGYTERVVSTSSSDKKTSYFSFKLTEDSWVYMTGSMSNFTHNGGSIHVNVYSDAAMTNAVDDFGWGYWESSEEMALMLTKGTYYASFTAYKANYTEDFEANINIIIGAIPVSKLIDTKVKVSANKKSATISFSDVLGTRTREAQYREGNVSSSYISDEKYWKHLVLTTSYIGASDATILELSGDTYSFKVKKDGYYTIRLADKDGNLYSKAVKVTGIDSKAPVITGVKNNKTYTKAVTIKFSDKGTGIKKATLNGKTIKSGSKVSASGSYTLKVTDKAGNTKVIKFKIK
jgi:hypothetical protein